MKAFTVRFTDDIWHKFLEIRGRWMIKHGVDINNVDALQLIIKQTPDIILTPKDLTNQRLRS